MIESPTRFSTNIVIERLIDKYCPQNATILDVGCGGGYYSYFISHGVKGSYLGIDIKEHETWQAREENGLHLSFLVYDAEKLQNLNQKFDFIIAIQSFEHIKNDVEAMKGMKICLKEGGYIMLTIPSKYSLFLYGFHGYRSYSISKIKRLADGNGLSVIEVIKLGGLASFFLHFILWTIPAVLLRIKIWKIYKKSKFLINSIAKLERLSVSIDKTLPLLEGGYAVVLKTEEVKLL